MAKYPPENAVDGGFGRRDTSPAADRRLAENFDNAKPKGNLYAPDMPQNSVEPEAGANGAAQGTEGIAPLFRPGSLRATSWMSAPFNAIVSPEGCETEVRDIDIYLYGDCYDPKAPVRSIDVSDKWQMDSDFDGSKN